MTGSSVPAHATPALRLGALLDLADALAGEAEDLADVAERQLVVLQDAVAELDDRLLFERQLLDRLLDGGALPERLQVRHPGARDVGGHPVRQVAQLVPEARPRLRVRVRVEQQHRELALADLELLADFRGAGFEDARDVLTLAVEEVRDLAERSE